MDKTPYCCEPECRETPTHTVWPEDPSKEPCYYASWDACPGHIAKLADGKVMRLVPIKPKG